MKPYRPPKKTLNSAAEAGDMESIMFHLPEGADVNARIASGHFPLAGAAKWGHAQAVRFLLDHGAEIDMLTTLHWTALILAAWREHLDVAAVLLSAGASTKPRTLRSDYGGSPKDFTALHAAADTGNSTMVRLLLKHGADYRKKAEGLLPEDVARAKGHKAVATLLGERRRARRSGRVTGRS